MRKLNRFVAMLLAFIVIACSDGRPNPLPIQPEDLCARCKMAISQKQFACQFFNLDGDVYKFDDFQCMKKFIEVRQLQNKIDAVFISDYKTKTWIDARSAFYVFTAEIKTPMQGGIIAFEDKRTADEIARENNSVPMTFADLNIISVGK